MKHSKAIFLADISEDTGLPSLRPGSLSMDEAERLLKDGQLVLVVRISKSGFGFVRPLAYGDFEEVEERKRYKTPHNLPAPQRMFQQKLRLPKREK